MTKDKSLLLEQIRDLLIINTSSLPDLGLYGGKMGVAIFFAHYARYTKQDVYLDLVYSLIEETFDDLHSAHVYNLDMGLSGIGWAVNYILYHHFLSGDPADVLMDLDQELMQYDVRRIKDLSFDTGLGGIAFYVLSRLHTHVRQNKLVFDNLFISDLMTTANIKEEYQIDACKLPDFLSGKNSTLTDSWIKMPLGLKNGLAGYGLKLMDV